MRRVLLVFAFPILAASPALALGDEVVSISVDAQIPPRTPDVPTLSRTVPAAVFAMSRGAAASPGLYADLISRIATEEQVEAALVHAIIKVESNYDARAISRKGAQGLMQLMPGTSDRYAVRDPLDPEANIRGGVRYLRFLQELFPGSLPLALAAYNAGENAVLRHNGIPPYQETRQYVERVLAHYGRRDSAAAPPDARSAKQTGDMTQAKESTPSGKIFRVVDADGALTYTNVLPATRSRSVP